MADVRALLKAKRQEARVTHPYANYSTTGQLRCTICGTVVKQASMWEGHIGSKAHRVNVVHLRVKEADREEDEARRAREQETQRVQGKRKATGEDGHDRKKRRISDEEEQQDISRSTTAGVTKGGFPTDFFSDATRVIPAAEGDEEEDESAAAAPPPAVKSQVDLEWEMFQASVINAPDNEKEEDRKDAYERATIFAEPELASLIPEGFPSQTGGDEDIPTNEKAKEETEDEKRKHKEQEEKELIMDRLIEEERAQEDADSRVSILKARMDALKKARQTKKFAGKKGS